MVLLMTLPLLARRRLPFGAPAFVLVAAGVVSFLEGQVPYSLVAFFAVLTSSFLLAFLNDRREALLGLLILLSVGAVVTRNDPEGAVGDYLFTAPLQRVLGRRVRAQPAARAGVRARGRSQARSGGALCGRGGADPHRARAARRGRALGQRDDGAGRSRAPPAEAGAGARARHSRSSRRRVARR